MSRKRDERAWAAYQRWLDSYGDRCRRCGLPVFWHSHKKHPGWCVVIAPAPPDTLEYVDPDVAGGPVTIARFVDYAAPQEDAP
jgi:hypothetical protein